MALIPLTYKLDWYDPSQPGGVISTINNNANTATSSSTQYSMQDVIDTVVGGGVMPWPYEYDATDENFIQGESPTPGSTGNTGYGVNCLPILNTGQNNTAFGANTGLNLEDSSDNVLIGYDAGRNMRPAGTPCDRNTLVGSRITFSLNPQGDDNTCVGYQAGSNIDTGFRNVFLGSDAGRSNSIGADNIAIGYKALDFQGGASRNVAIGSLALTVSLSTGNNNTAVGYEAGTQVTSGDNNVLFGYQAGSTITTGTNNICIGYTAEPSSGTVVNEITIGNTNNTTLRLPGLQTTASDGDVLTYSTATGDIQLQAPGGGGATDLNGLSDCLIDGTSSYLVNVPAGLSGNPVDNTVLGNGAGNALTTGANNTLIGSLVGDSITTGTKNVAIGDEALSSAGISVGGTVAIGYQAGLSAASSNSIYVGYQSGKSNSGNGFIAVGYRSGYSNTSGSWNTTLGYFAAYTNTTGNENTTIGTEAGYNNTGTGNTFLGYQAGYTQTTGSNNTVIGHDAEPSAVTVSDEITLGDANIVTLRCAVNTITLISDERDKTDIQDIDYGLDLIEKLKPRKFTWNSRDGKKQGQKEVGFIAQELQQVDDEYLNFVLDNNPDKLEAGWMQLVPVLVKAIQELKEEIEELKRDRNV